jgi:RNA polymerase sigma-70 factor (ECF subfamily)
MYANRGPGRPVLALAHAVSGSRWAAEELTQEAFLAAFRQWQQIDNPEGWVRTVVANRARSALRRRYAETKALARAGVGHDITVDPMPAESADFWAEVRRLPIRQAQSVALYCLDDRPTSDIADILGCSESTVRVHLSRGRKSLAKRLGVQP